MSDTLHYSPHEPPSSYLRELYKPRDEVKSWGKLLQEIEDGVAGILPRWNVLNPEYWRLDRLRDQDGRWRKPRVISVVDSTTKGNLTLRWYPDGEYVAREPGRPAEKNVTDFSDRILWRLDQAAIAERPFNELLMLHDWTSLKSFCRSRPEQALLLAGIALVHQCVESLRFFVEVRQETNIEPEIVDGKVTGCSIFNVLDRKHEAGEAVIRRLHEEIGVDLLALVEIRQKDTKDEDIQRELKKRGHKVGLGQLRKVLRRLEAHGSFDAPETKRRRLWRYNCGQEYVDEARILNTSAPVSD